MFRGILLILGPSHGCGESELSVCVGEDGEAAVIVAFAGFLV